MKQPPRWAQKLLHWWGHPDTLEEVQPGRRSGRSARTLWVLGADGGRAKSPMALRPECAEIIAPISQINN